MKKIKALFAGLLMPLLLLAQTDLPTDYLTKEFHASRREALRQLMPENSVAAVFAFPENTYSNDVTYPFHQNPDLYYFSGYREPNSVLLIFKDPVKLADGKEAREVFFVQKRNAAAEQWTGRRLGIEGVKKNLGFEVVLNGESFRDFSLDFSRFEHVLFDAFPEAVRDNPRDGADLYDLIKIFKQKAGVADDYDHSVSRSLSNLKTLQPAELERAKRYYSSQVRNNAKLNGPVFQEFLKIKDGEELKAFQAKLPAPRILDLGPTLATLREVKTPEEITLMRKAVEISGIGQLEVMKAVHPEMSETELQGIHEFVHKKYGAEGVGYPSIVGAGDNGCILHYIDNNRTKSGNNLVLMDVGAEYHGYTADITRTIPANGKFSPEQKAIYDLVYQAQEEVFKICKEGTPFADLNNKAKEVLGAGLKKLGIIQKDEELRTYFPHGVSHHLGLDVHDKSAYGPLKENMILTVEPGIYIPENSPCDKKWWGIAVRIEDDVLIGKEHGEVLSGSFARKAEDVERVVAQKSVLNDFKLPKLKSK